MSTHNHPHLGFIVPGWNENRWSDLLASLITTDPTPMGRLLGTSVDGVRREVSAPGEETKKSDRLDLLLTQRDSDVAAIEVKVLSDLGLDQLARYTDAFPRATRRFVLHLSSLPVNTSSAPEWETLTWEDVLNTYAQSGHPWVAITAAAWRDQIGTLIPAVDAATVWNDVPDDAHGFELALRARIAWLASNLDEFAPSMDIVQSTGGGIWVLRLWSDTDVPNLRVQVEVQEGMTAYEWGIDQARAYGDRLKGPAPMVALRLSNVDSSEAFDWTLLHRVFAANFLDAENEPTSDWPWQRTSASPRHPVDRAGWKAMTGAGAPRWLGKGFGMAAATKSARECLFGARMQFAPTLTLGQVRDELRRFKPVLHAMAITVNQAHAARME